MSVLDSFWLAVLFVPLVYIVVLGRRDEPAQRLVALVQALAALVAAAISPFRRGRPKD